MRHCSSTVVGRVPRQKRQAWPGRAHGPGRLEAVKSVQCHDSIVDGGAQPLGSRRAKDQLRRREKLIRDDDAAPAAAPSADREAERRAPRFFEPRGAPCRHPRRPHLPCSANGARRARTAALDQGDEGDHKESAGLATAAFTQAGRTSRSGTGVRARAAREGSLPQTQEARLLVRVIKTGLVSGICLNLRNGESSAGGRASQACFAVFYCSLSRTRGSSRGSSLGLNPASARVTIRVVRKWARRSPNASCLLIAGRVVSDSTSPPSPFLTLALEFANGDEQGGPQPQKQSQ